MDFDETENFERKIIANIKAFVRSAPEGGRELSMKLKIFIVVVAVVMAWVAGRCIKGGGQSFVASMQQETQGQAQDDGSSEQRINETYALAEGARVDVHGINGPVTVEAIDGNTAEVRVTSTAGSVGDLAKRRPTIEHTDSSLVIRGKGNHNGGFWKWLRGGGEVRHTVVLRVPRHVVLAMRGTNGKVSIGDIEGSVEVSGINGRVEIGRAGGGAEVSGVNGNVTLTVMELDKKNLKVHGVNGGVELRLGSNLNADLKANGVNGSVKIEAPNVEVQEQKRSKLRARIGKGGAEINVNGINGGVRLVGV